MRKGLLLPALPRPCSPSCWPISAGTRGTPPSTAIEQLLEGERLLAQAGDRENSTRALILAGMHMGASGDAERASGYLDRGLAQARETGDAWAIATTLRARAHAAIADDDYTLARRQAEEATTVFPIGSDQHSLAQVQNVLGDISRLEGKYEEARGHYEYERAAVLAREAGSSGMLPSMQHNLAWSLHGLGDDQGATDLFTSTVRNFQRMGDTRGVAECLVGLGCAVPQPEIAARLFAAGCSLLEEHGTSLSHPNQREYDREAERVREVLGEGAWRAAWAEGVKLTPDQALRLARPAAAIEERSPGQGLDGE